MPRSNVIPMRRRSKNNLETAWKAKGYRFIDRDPEIDMICFIMEQSGLSDKEIARESGVSKSTIYNWKYGHTRKPQNLTLRAVARTCGYDRIWVKL